MTDAQLDRLITAIGFIGRWDFWMLIALVFIANYLGYIALRLKHVDAALRLQQGLIDQETYAQETRMTPLVRLGFVIALMIVILLFVMAASTWWMFAR